MSAKVKLVVLCQKKDITQYLNTFGVSRVLTAPLAQKQIVKIAIDASPNKTATKQVKAKTLKPSQVEQPITQTVQNVNLQQPPVLRRMKLAPPPHNIWKEAAIVAASFLVMSMALLGALQLFVPGILPSEVSEFIAIPLSQFASVAPVLQWQAYNIGADIFGMNIFG